MSLFGIDIAGEIATGFDGLLNPATLTRDNPGTYDPTNDTYSGGGADQEFTTEGVVTEYSDSLVAEGVVQSNDRKILLIADKLGTKPSPGDSDKDPDEITIEGQTFTVVDVDKDPAGATYVVQGRL